MLYSLDYLFCRRGSSIPKNYRVNDQITAQAVLVVDDKGNQLGELTTDKALEMATEKGLDLVEVASSANPPVCRLLNYGKFRYEATRKEREARKASKTKSNNTVREVRMKTRIGDHDREAKTRLVKRLLTEGSKVRVSVMFRGREVQHPQIGMALLKKVAEDLQEDALLEKAPSFEGRFLAMILAPSPSLKKNKNDREPESAKT
ncbi:MAG TPA: translation initiation factor IF-3 [Dehalococcoidia bacterium]|jgi:translation initiation factor IF-3|nr:translation initiation factor IF-3 [Dehalococcoidia bacterium]